MLEKFPLISRVFELQSTGNALGIGQLKLFLPSLTAVVSLSANIHIGIMPVKLLLESSMPSITLPAFHNDSGTDPVCPLFETEK